MSFGVTLICRLMRLGPGIQLGSSSRGHSLRYHLREEGRWGKQPSNSVTKPLFSKPFLKEVNLQVDSKTKQIGNLFLDRLSMQSQHDSTGQR